MENWPYDSSTHLHQGSIYVSVDTINVDSEHCDIEVTISKTHYINNTTNQVVESIAKTNKYIILLNQKVSLFLTYSFFIGYICIFEKIEWTNTAISFTQSHMHTNNGNLHYGIFEIFDGDFTFWYVLLRKHDEHDNMFRNNSKMIEIHMGCDKVRDIWNLIPLF